MSKADEDVDVAIDDRLDALVFDLLDYIDGGHRSYWQTMEAWRTSCPRLAVWEEAVLRGFVVRAPLHGDESVALTEAGRAFLARYRRTS